MKRHWLPTIVVLMGVVGCDRSQAPDTRRGGADGHSPPVVRGQGDDISTDQTAHDADSPQATRPKPSDISPVGGLIEEEENSLGTPTGAATQQPLEGPDLDLQDSSSGRVSEGNPTGSDATSGAADVQTAPGIQGNNSP